MDVEPLKWRSALSAGRGGVRGRGASTCCRAGARLATATAPRQHTRPSTRRRSSQYRERASWLEDDQGRQASRRGTGSGSGDERTSGLAGGWPAIPDTRQQRSRRPGQRLVSVPACRGQCRGHDARGRYKNGRLEGSTSGRAGQRRPRRASWARRAKRLRGATDGRAQADEQPGRRRGRRHERPRPAALEAPALCRSSDTTVCPPGESAWRWAPLRAPD